MNYLHEHKPEAIIHRDLEPSYVLISYHFIFRDSCMKKDREMVRVDHVKF